MAINDKSITREDGSVDFQPVYDNFKDFKAGMLVTCRQLLPVPEKLFTSEALEHRAIDFYGLVSCQLIPDWFLVQHIEPNGGEPIYTEAMFHRDELGWGYNPSHHPSNQKNSLHKWLSNK